VWGSAKNHECCGLSLTKLSVVLEPDQALLISEQSVHSGLELSAQTSYRTATVVTMPSSLI